MATQFKGVIALPAAVMVGATAACAGDPPVPTPNIEATVEARVKEETASQPTPTPKPTATRVEPTRTQRPTRKPTSTPNPAYLYFGEGEIHANNGEFLLAIEDFSKAIDAAPGRAYMYVWRAGSYYKLGLEVTNDNEKRRWYNKAVNDLSEAIQLDRTDADFHFGRGRSHYQL